MTTRQKNRCRQKSRKASGRGGYVSVWYVQCSKPRARGHIYCEKHTAEFYARVAAVKAAREARQALFDFFPVCTHCGRKHAPSVRCESLGFDEFPLPDAK